MVVKITKRQILQFHDFVLHQHGGLQGIREPGYLDLIIEKPFTVYFGEEQYPGFFMKAAVYWHGISTSHCFSDDNKRTAMMTALIFLQLNGYALKANNKELFEIAITVATSEISLEELAKWIESHV